MNMQVRCDVGTKPFVLQNPVMPAPGSYGNVIEFAKFEDLSRIGALVPNSMLSADGTPSLNNKFAHLSSGYLNAYGPNNIGLKRFIETVLDRLPEGVPVIVDLKARSMDEMAEMTALAAQTAKITAIEVNLNCPYAAASPLYWEDARQLEKLMQMVKRNAVEKPVIVKGPSGLYPLAPMIEVLEATGADMFTPFNCLRGLSVNLRTRISQSGGYIGAGVKSVGLRVCQEAAALSKMPIIGAGGIGCAEDVLEYIMAGAFAVQVGAANLTRPDFLGRLLNDLEVLMQELDIASLDDIRGVAAPQETNLF